MSVLAKELIFSGYGETSWIVGFVAYRDIVVRDTAEERKMGAEGAAESSEALEVAQPHYELKAVVETMGALTSIQRGLFPMGCRSTNNGTVHVALLLS